MYAMVHILWWDAASPEAGWLSKEDFLASCNILKSRTIGFLVYEDEEQIKVCQSYFPLDDQMSQGIAIPKKWIESCIYLTHPDMDKWVTESAREPSGPSTPVESQIPSVAGQKVDVIGKCASNHVTT